MPTTGTKVWSVDVDFELEELTLLQPTKDSDYWVVKDKYDQMRTMRIDSYCETPQAALSIALLELGRLQARIEKQMRELV